MGENDVVGCDEGIRAVGGAVLVGDADDGPGQCMCFRMVPSALYFMPSLLQ